MPDEQDKGNTPEAFGTVADKSVEAGIADEAAAYDQAMRSGDKPTTGDAPSPDEMEDRV